jgi:hypothetical protein
MGCVLHECVIPSARRIRSVNGRLERGRGLWETRLRACRITPGPGYTVCEGMWKDGKCIAARQGVTRTSARPSRRTRFDSPSDCGERVVALEASLLVASDWVDGIFAW